ncbi:MAG: LLM class flavin-dependent oxidoreductase [Pseudomonadota bacterium]
MSATHGLFLNLGANLASDQRSVFELALEEAKRAEAFGLHDLWVTEHHFIPFGLNPCALTLSAFLLGRTERARVGTAVVLSPLQHAVSLAERAALLDQLSGGRFDLGLGRGGYLKDYEVLERPTACWDSEPVASAETILRCWHGEDLAQVEHVTGPSVMQPQPLTAPEPSLFLATSSENGIRFAAERGLPLQHYFAAPVEARVKVEQAYSSIGPQETPVEHVHTLIVAFGDDESATRERLAAALTESFSGGNWPHVPQAPKRHADADGNPLTAADMARGAAQRALVGSPESVKDQLVAFREATGAQRLVYFLEAIGDPSEVVDGIDTLCERVIC